MLPASQITKLNLVDRVLLQQVIESHDECRGSHAGCRRPGARLAIRIEEQPSGSIVVLVQDSGVGLDPQLSNRMFEAFYTTKEQGIGMGLTISRSIIEAHGGRLWAVKIQRRGVMQKMQASSLADLVRMADKLGIPPPKE